LNINLILIVHSIKKDNNKIIYLVYAYKDVREFEEIPFNRTKYGLEINKNIKKQAKKNGKFY
jgi:hypothetical protein